MNRKDITKSLSKLLVRDVLQKSYWANEVTFNWGREGECRVDFMKFEPVNQSTSGIEKGSFTVYEVKSCIDDYRSKNGHNMIGDKNYYVMTMETYKAVVRELSFYVGVYVAVPKDKTHLQHFDNTTPFTGNIDSWKLVCIKKCNSVERKHSIATCLFMMLRSGANYD